MAETLTSLGTGAAVVTVLSERGAPTPVAWTMVRAPWSFIGQIDPAGQQQAVASSPLNATYAVAADRESAYEQLAARLAPPPTPPAPAPTPTPAPAPTPRPAPSVEPDSWREPDLGRAEPAPRRPERVISRSAGGSD